MERTNALAELAKNLNYTLKEMLDEGRYDFPYLEEICKAQRIIAELAKVEKPIDLRTVGMTHLADILEADKIRAVEIVRNCRIIATEGAGDGK